MKKVMSIALLVVAVGAVVGMNVNWSGEPDYIQSAKARVGSYLTSDYGRVACNSKQIDDERWELGCTNPSKSKTFQFAVFSADKARMASRVHSIWKRSTMMQNRARNRA